jgi:hypothetical protein
MIELINERIEHPFEVHFDNPGGRVLTSPYGEVLCEARSDYIPIEEFKELFYKNSEAIEKVEGTKFIFDKRSLKAFHQPSMEWYCVEWKKEVYERYGLQVHRKILPDEVWFQRAVEAGLHDIRQQYEDHPLDSLDIAYVGSVDEALRS